MAKTIGRFTASGDLLPQYAFERGMRDHILDVEDDDLTLSELRLKLSAAEEGHDEWLADVIRKDIRRRRSK